MKQYLAVEFTTGFFTGNISAARLQKILNKYSIDGWTLRTTIQETRRMLLIFRREVHVLIFEKPVEVKYPTPAIPAAAVPPPLR